MPNETKQVISASTSVTDTSTNALAASMARRWGTAENVARIMPVVYSELIVIAPSVPTMSWAMYTPLKLTFVASKPGWIVPGV